MTRLGHVRNRLTWTRLQSSMSCSWSRVHARVEREIQMVCIILDDRSVFVGGELLFLSLLLCVMAHKGAGVVYVNVDKT